ncbi:MAG: SIS domain-containing protein [Stomatobaculum sp.]|nr:SIS domain-containing protein [Stomatobaculum sp.]
MNDTLNVILKEIEGVLAQVDDAQISDVMGAFSKERRVFVDGEGRSGFSAKGFAMRLMHIGYTVFFVGETITPALKEGDLFIAVSGSGKSANVINDSKKAKSAGAELIAVTSKPESPLASEADRILVIPGTVKGDSGSGRASVQLLSSLFDQSLHIVLDALCLLLSRRDNTANETATGAHW